MRSFLRPIFVREVALAFVFNACECLVLTGLFSWRSISICLHRDIGAELGAQHREEGAHVAHIIGRCKK